MPTAEPRTLRDTAELAGRLRRAETEPRVRPLNAWADDVARRAGQPTGLPRFDPDAGGTKARALFLLESPGQRAVHSDHGLVKPGSGLISQDNDDQTAENMWRARKAAGIEYRDVCSWNVVPWYIGEANRNATPTADELRRALPYLTELLALLPRLVVVVPMGRVAQRQWYTHLARRPSDLVTIPAFHPSPRSLASPRHREALARSLAQVAAVLASRE